MPNSEPYPEHAEKCWKCGCPDINSEVKDTIANVACEIEYSCANCGNLVAYYAYGSYDPNLKPKELNEALRLR